MPPLRGGLTLRTILACGLLALVVGAVFTVLLVVIVDQRGSRDLALHSRAELASADGLLKLLVDLETGQRGYVITRKERFLEPWRAARTALPERARRLARLADDPGQARRAREIVRATTSYLQDYSVPLVNAARRGEASARSVAVTEEGKQRVDALRAQFDRFRTVERDLLEARQNGVDADGRRAIVVAAAGLVGSILLILLFGVYLARGIGRPVGRAAAMAGRLAGGDLAVRMPETGPAEVGELERAFNTLAGSLEASRAELTRLLEEQAALRRVATLVAQAVSPPEVFESVTREVGLLSGADLARMERYESDDEVTGVAGWSRDRDRDLAVGTRFALEGVSIAALVWQRRGPARVDSFVHASGPIAQEARALGLRSSVGCPIVVEGKLWGVIAASSRREAAFPPDTESQIAEFTELVATAIANAESRAEVMASRARVVAAADESRRRIERDLHDGAQQRLVSLALELREAESAVPPGLHELKERLSETAKGVSEVLEELQELSRGIHPAILSEGGLAPALKTLARRSAVPVELDVDAERRLPEQVEVTAYFVASEALTNAAKHAQASIVQVHFEARNGMARLAIRDDGVGGAEPGRGSGLIGLTDRVEAIGGSIEMRSPAGSGTSLLVELPIEGS